MNLILKRTISFVVNLGRSFHPVRLFDDRTSFHRRDSHRLSHQYHKIALRVFEMSQRIGITRMMSKLPVNVLFLSHGGGPLPLLGHEGHTEMVETLQHVAKTIKRPEAIVVISAHWEEEIPTITGGSSPDLIYDYLT